MNNRTHVLIVCIFSVLMGCANAPLRPSTDATMAADKLIDKGVYHLRLGDLIRAESAFYAAQEIAPRAAALDGLGCVAFLRKDFASSEDLFLESIRLDPGYTRAIGNLALLYEVTGRRREALDLYRQAIARDPQNVAARNNFAGLLYDYRLSDGRRAGEAVRRAKGELLKAQAVMEHPIVTESLEVLE